MIRLRVTNKQGQQSVEHAEGPLELGRGPQCGSAPRLVIQDLYVSRDQLRIEELDGGRVRVENLSRRNAVRLAGQSLPAPGAGQELPLPSPPNWPPATSALAPGASQELPLPVHLVIGESRIDIEPAADGASSRAESFETISPAAQRRRGPEAGARPFDLGAAPTLETLADWFETVLFVQRAAAGSPEFYQETARALVDLIGLDRGLVLLRRGDRWDVAARHPGDREAFPGREVSGYILRRVVESRQTVYQSSPDFDLSAMHQSLVGVEAVVASPVFDARDEVVGVLYGSRSRSAGGRGVSIGQLEARVVQVLASAVGAGLARVEQERAALAARVQFEQFFSAELARELERNPGLLEGQEREVTVLFSDIRGFSRMAERVGPGRTFRLMSDVMDQITGRVREFGGVVVDYYGDGMLAMWNAPADQPDHPALACRAALAMLGDLPALSERWGEVVGGPLGLGIGVNTGPALVGNTGSRHKFKYGPLGHAVNLASRIEGASKRFGVPALITGPTRARLCDDFVTRRLCRARLVGFEEPVDLFELHAGEATAEWLDRRQRYEAALAQFEAGEWAAACGTLQPLLAQAGGGDPASLQLLSVAVECLRARPEHFDGILELNTK